MTHLVRKGLNLPLKGAPTTQVDALQQSTTFAVSPDDYQGMIPKMAVREGDKVAAGDTIFYHKSDDRLSAIAPVSGTVKAIVRGAKRRILRVEMSADSTTTYKQHAAGLPADADALKARLTETGLWTLLEMRPYARMVNPDDAPKAIFVNAMATAPFAPEASIALSGRDAGFEAGLKALKLLAPRVVLSLDVNESAKSLTQADAEIHRFSGKHPAGNTSVHISRVDPLNKGEVVWTLDAESVAIMGDALLSGEAKLDRTLTLGGTGFRQPRYVKAIPGMNLETAMGSEMHNDRPYRLINGSVLTGRATSADGFLAFGVNQLTAIPEGQGTDFLGWVLPGFGKFSVSRTFPAFLSPKKQYDLSTKLNGEDRNFVVTGEYDKVFPFDIYPSQLLKAAWANDMERMEQLGIYEVAPEDFALCEVVCTSKQSLQSLIREGLDLIYSEMN